MIEKICKELKEAIKDEDAGILSYQYLQNEFERLGKEKESEAMRKIKVQEMLHKNELIRIVDKLCKEVV
jgi:hypothetical protein